MRKWMALLAAALLVGGVGCGSDGDGGDDGGGGGSGGGGGGLHDPLCDLFTPEEVGEILGNAVSESQGAAANVCDYQIDGTDLSELGAGFAVYWGRADTYDAAVCGALEERGYASGSKEACRSLWGAFDLSGNFREWTSTAPTGKDGRRVVKGGLRHDPQRGSRCAYAVDESTGLKEASTGFRCCRDADAPPVADPAADGTPPQP